MTTEYYKQYHGRFIVGSRYAGVAFDPGLTLQGQLTITNAIKNKGSAEASTHSSRC